MNIIRKARKFLSRIKHAPVWSSRPSLNQLDRKLQKYLDFRNGFFIECGANDGYFQSNTYFLEKRLGWRGILIEAIPELYEKCKKNRAESTVYNYALVEDGFPNPTVTMHFAGLVSMVDGALKTKEEQEKHLQTGLEVQYLESSYSVDVPAKALGMILDETQNISNIDFFSLDVEGYELNVLKGLNLSIYRPKYILIEARFFAEVNTFLEEHDYILVEKMSRHDYLYQSKSKM